MDHDEYFSGRNGRTEIYDSFVSDEEFLGLQSDYYDHTNVSAATYESRASRTHHYTHQNNASSISDDSYSSQRSPGFASSQWGNYQDHDTVSHSSTQDIFYPNSQSQRQYALPTTHIADEQRQWTAYSQDNLRSVPSHDIQNSKPAPRNTHGIQLRPVSELPDIYRSMFKFGVFNAVQSTCFDHILGNNINMVISAPTGSGKTVLFELAIIRALEHSKNSSKPVKCIYVAPTKALCTQKFQEWTAKFEPVGFKCAELTGDTVVFGSSAWGNAKNASIIVTTCEKWDSLTRNWTEHETIMSQIGLFLVDEVHILNESRGSTLEVVVSRMKFRAPALRFILVSATVPNIDDVARWIGCGTSKGEQARVFQFGDEYRPCKLTRHIVPVHRRHDQNDFQFAKILDFRLFKVIQEFSTGRPILIFCPTRKGAFDAAEQLMKDYLALEAKKERLPWDRPHRLNQSFNEKRLDELVAVGLGVHHAGLPIDDRRLTEGLFSKKHIKVLVATSTLAVGVNLPAHMVIIKGVHLFQNNESKEYSDLDVMQMLGRAGRPQFDKDGVAVILCESNLEAKYTALVQGQTILESCLNTNLPEHINSEIGLGTITDIKSAKNWIYGSFLYQRMQKNPRYYALGDEKDRTCQERVDDMVLNTVSQLKEISLIEYDEQGGDDGALRSTPYGEIMSKYYLRRTTMQTMLGLPPHSSLRDILEAMCSAEEFNDVKLRGSEKTVFNKLRKDMDIRFEISKVEKTSDKVFLLVQAVLGGVSWQNPDYKSGDSQPYLESFSIFKHIPRIAKAAVDISIIKGDGAQLKNALELVRCLSAKAWEDRAIVMRQIEQIGEKSIKVLAEHGIASLVALQKQSALRIETLLNRRPPFGLDVLRSLSEFPQYDLKIKEHRVKSNQGKSPVEVELSIQCSLVGGSGNPSKAKKYTRAQSFSVAVILTLTSDMELIDLRRIPSKALKDSRTFEVTVMLKKPSQSVIVQISSENIAGLVVQKSYKPNISAEEYPVPDTRPMTAVDMDLLGLEDDPDFWNMTIDTSEAEGQYNPLIKSPAPPSTFQDKTANNRGITATTHKKATTKGKPAMPNGRFSCNHTCKDKLNCRHLCCREGLEEPPKMKKRPQVDRVEEKPTPSSSVLQLLDATKRPKEKAAVMKNERKMNELNRIHAQAKVEENLQLKVGQRIKLEAGPPKKRKEAIPNYDIQFTQLHDDIDDDIQSDWDSEELPETVTSTLPPPTGIAATKPVKLPAPHKHHKPSPTKTATKTGAGTSLYPSFTTSPPRKRPKVRHSPKDDVPLFLELSDNEADLEDVTEEGGWFDSPMTPPSTKTYMHIESARPARSPSPIAPAAQFSPKKAYCKDESDGNDELDELDEWLNSNSVQIL